MIKFEIKKMVITDIDLGGSIGNNLNKNLKNIINFDIIEVENSLKNIISNETENGIVPIHFFWDEGKIQIDCRVKITYDIENFRGGYRINIYINNFESQIKIIKEIILLFSRYTDINSRNEIYKIMENFNDIKQLSEIIKNISSYNMMIGRIILMLVIYPSLQL